MEDSYLERKLAIRIITKKLEKECATNPVVHSCLTAVINGDCSLEDGLIGCIRMLAEANEKYIGPLTDMHMRNPQPILITKPVVTELKEDSNG